MERIDFQRINRAALTALPAILSRWLPDGKLTGHEWVARNPRRGDEHPGSFKINMNTGRWLISRQVTVVETPSLLPPTFSTCASWRLRHVFRTCLDWGTHHESSGRFPAGTLCPFVCTGTEHKHPYDNHGIWNMESHFTSST